MMLGLFQPLNHRISDWQNKRIWIIGASSGIGAALALEFLAKGAEVIVSARRKEQLEKLTQHHSKAHVLVLDVSSTIAWDFASSEIKQKYGELDLVVFCAAKYQPERSWEINPIEMEQTLSINLESVYRGISISLPEMIKQGRGGLAIIASVAGYVGLPNASVYGPSKAALINLAELLYMDLHPKNLDVYLINPGFVKTELTAKNSFFMPALQTPRQAALAIMHGMEKGQFEIHFPKRFTLALKFLQLLPYRIRFALLHGLTKQ
jgi:short-subunit dehydrogenase